MPLGDGWVEGGGRRKSLAMQIRMLEAESLVAGWLSGEIDGVFLAYVMRGCIGRERRWVTTVRACLSLFFLLCFVSFCASDGGGGGVFFSFTPSLFPAFSCLFSLNIIAIARYQPPILTSHPNNPDRAKPLRFCLDARKSSSTSRGAVIGGYSNAVCAMSVISNA